MRAVEFDRFGKSDVLEIRDIPAPVLRDGRVLVRVRAASVNPKDLLVRGGKFRLFSGLTFPRRVGYDWSGEVVQVASGVTGLRVGDALYGMFQPWGRGGACAEYVEVKPDECASMPSGLSFDEAAALPLAGLTAWQAIRDLGQVVAGSRVLIHGASGGVGVFAVQIAKALGAQVTAVCGPRNIEFCRELGADRVVDYTQQDPTRCGETFDLFFDVFGDRSLGEARSVLAPRGVYVSTVPKARVLREMLATSFSWPRARLIVVRARRSDLESLAALVERGVLRVVLDQSFSFGEIAAAQDRVATKHVRGKVVVRVSDP